MAEGMISLQLAMRGITWDYLPNVADPLADLPTEMRTIIWDLLPFYAHLHLSVCSTWLAVEMAPRVVVPPTWPRTFVGYTEYQMSIFVRAKNQARSFGIHLWPGIDHLHAVILLGDFSFELQSHEGLHLRYGLLDCGVEITFSGHEPDPLVTAALPIPSVRGFTLISRDRTWADAFSYLKSLACERKKEAERDAHSARLSSPPALSFPS